MTSQAVYCLSLQIRPPSEENSNSIANNEIGRDNSTNTNSSSSNNGNSGSNNNNSSNNGTSTSNTTSTKMGNSASLSKITTTLEKGLRALENNNDVNNSNSGLVGVGLGGGSNSGGSNNGNGSGANMLAREQHTMTSNASSNTVQHHHQHQQTTSHLKTLHHHHHHHQQQQQQQQQQQHSNIILVRGARTENGQIILQNSHELLSLLSDEDNKPIILQHPRIKSAATSTITKAHQLNGETTATIGTATGGGTILLQTPIKGGQLEAGAVLLQSTNIKKGILPEGSIILQQRLSNKISTADGATLTLANPGSSQTTGAGITTATTGTTTAGGPFLLQTLKRLDKSQSILVFRNPNNNHATAATVVGSAAGTNSSSGSSSSTLTAATLQLQTTGGPMTTLTKAAITSRISKSNNGHGNSTNSNISGGSNNNSNNTGNNTGIGNNGSNSNKNGNNNSTQTALMTNRGGNLDDIEDKIELIQPQQQKSMNIPLGSDGEPIKLPENLESLPRADHFPTQRHRWNTNEEIAAILISFDKHSEWQSKEVKTRPKSGSLLLYSRKKVRYRRDGYCWKKRKDGKTTREDHMKLKVQGTECIYGCYVHSAILPTFHRRCYWLLQNPDIVLVHYLNVPYPDDNKMAVITPSLSLWGDKKEWTKEELVSQLKPMFFSEDETDSGNDIEISTAETVEAIVSQLMEKQRLARQAALVKQLECGCPDSTCADGKSCSHPMRRGNASKSSLGDKRQENNNQVSSTTPNVLIGPRLYSRWIDRRNRESINDLSQKSLDSGSSIHFQVIPNLHNHSNMSAATVHHHQQQQQQQQHLHNQHHQQQQQHHQLNRHHHNTPSLVHNSSQVNTHLLSLASNNNAGVITVSNSTGASSSTTSSPLSVANNGNQGFTNASNNGNQINRLHGAGNITITTSAAGAIANCNNVSTNTTSRANNGNNGGDSNGNNQSGNNNGNSGNSGGQLKSAHSNRQQQINLGNSSDNTSSSSSTIHHHHHQMRQQQQQQHQAMIDMNQQRMSSNLISNTTNTRMTGGGAAVDRNPNTSIVTSGTPPLVLNLSQLQSSGGSLLILNSGQQQSFVCQTSENQQQRKSNIIEQQQQSQVITPNLVPKQEAMDSTTTTTTISSSSSSSSASSNLDKHMQSIYDNLNYQATIHGTSIIESPDKEEHNLVKELNDSLPFFNETLDLSQEDIQKTLNANMPLSNNGITNSVNDDGIDSDINPMDFIDNVCDIGVSVTSDDPNGCAGIMGNGGVVTEGHDPDDVFVNLDAFDMLVEFPDLELDTKSGFPHDMSSLDGIKNLMQHHHHHQQQQHQQPDLATTDGLNINNTSNGNASDNHHHHNNNHLLKNNNNVDNLQGQIQQQQQQFNITDYSPEWAYPEGGVKVLVTGPWNLNSTYTVLFDSFPVPTTVVQSGVLRCYCPAHEVGLATLQVACDGYVISNSVIFEYKSPPNLETTSEGTTNDSLYKFTLLDRLSSIDDRMQIKTEPKDVPEESVIISQSNFEERLVNYCQILTNKTWRAMTPGSWPNGHRGMTLLHLASALGYSKLVCAMLSWRSENPNVILETEIDALSQDIQGNTPLTWACARGHLDTALIIYKWNNNSINIKNYLQQTPFDVARMNGYNKIVIELEKLQKDFLSNQQQDSTKTSSSLIRTTSFTRKFLNSPAMIDTDSTSNNSYEYEKGSSNNNSQNDEINISSNNSNNNSNNNHSSNNINRNLNSNKTSKIEVNSGNNSDLNNSNSSSNPLTIASSPYNNNDLKPNQDQDKKSQQNYLKNPSNENYGENENVGKNDENNAVKDLIISNNKSNVNAALNTSNNNSNSENISQCSSPNSNGSISSIASNRSHDGVFLRPGAVSSSQSPPSTRLSKRPSVDSGINMDIRSFSRVGKVFRDHTKYHSFDTNENFTLSMSDSGMDGNMSSGSITSNNSTNQSSLLSPLRKMDFALCEVSASDSSPIQDKQGCPSSDEDSTDAINMNESSGVVVGESDAKVLTLAEHIIAAMPERIKNESEEMMSLGSPISESLNTDTPGMSNLNDTFMEPLLDSLPNAQFDHEFNFEFSDHNYRYHDVGTPCSSLSPASSGPLQSPASYSIPQDPPMSSPSPPPSAQELTEFLRASSITQRGGFEAEFSNLTLTDREQRELYEAAKCIQKAYRSYKGRKKLEEQDKERSAAIVIQNYYRRYKQFAYYKQMTHAALVIQNGYRSYCENKRFKKSQNQSIPSDDQDSQCLRDYYEQQQQQKQQDQQNQQGQSGSNSGNRNGTTSKEASPSGPLKRTYSQRTQNQAARKIQQFMRQSKMKLQRERAEKEKLVHQRRAEYLRNLQYQGQPEIVRTQDLNDLQCPNQSRINNNLSSSDTIRDSNLINFWNT